MTDRPAPPAWAKVPAVSLGFWIIKIIATTLGETGGDSFSMSWLGETSSHSTGWGYGIATAILTVPLLVLVWAQIAARRFHPLLYWATIIASTTAGTTLADALDRSLGIGYPGGALLLFTAVMASLILWRWRLGSVSVQSVREPRAERFYWLTITLAQTLGTALGDWLADTSWRGQPIGYIGGAVIFAAALAVVAFLAWRTTISRAGLFWAAFILTRPLGATLGDFLDKPLAAGGLGFSRPLASLALLAAIALCLWIFPQRAARSDKHGPPTLTDRR